MMQQQIARGYVTNEIVVDSASFEGNLPSSIEAMFYLADCSSNEEQQARSAYAAFCERYPSADVPLLVLNVADWQVPFSLAQPSSSLSPYLGLLGLLLVPLGYVCMYCMCPSYLPNRLAPTVDYERSSMLRKTFLGSTTMVRVFACTTQHIPMRSTQLQPRTRTTSNSMLLTNCCIC